MTSTLRNLWICRSARLAGCILANVALTGLLRAQQTQFNPEVSVDVEHTDNVQFVSPQGTTAPDWIGNLRLVLPVARTWSTGSFSFVYTPSYVKHYTVTELDRLDQAVGVDLRVTPSRFSTVTTNLFWAKSQQQGRADSLRSPDFYLSTRTDRAISGGGVDAEIQFGRSWHGTFNANLSRERYTAIPGFPTLTPTSDVEDRNAYQSGFGVACAVTTKDDVGFGYVWSRFDLTLGDTETVHTVGLTWDRKLARDTRFGARLGAFSRVDDVPAGSTSAAVSGYGVAATMELEKMIRRSTLRFDVGYKPSSGGSLPGTSTDAAIGFGFRGETNPSWPWSLAARWVRRHPTDPVDATLTTTSLGASVEWRPRARTIGVRAHAWWATQLDGGVGDQAGQFLTAGTGLTWYPLGTVAARRR